MVVVTEAVREGIIFFGGLSGIIVPLAIGEAFKQFFGEKHEKSGEPTLHLDRLPALVTLLTVAVTFYLGMDRYFNAAYIHAITLRENYERHLVGDSFLFMLEAAVFFGMSRNLAAKRWKDFCHLFIALLVIDIVWCLHAKLMAAALEATFRGWIILDGVLAALLLVVRFVRLPRSLLRLWPWLGSPFLASCIVFILNLAILRLGYSEFWASYFPTE